MNHHFDPEFPWNDIRDEGPLDTSDRVTDNVSDFKKRIRSIWTRLDKPRGSTPNLRFRRLRLLVGRSTPFLAGIGAIVGSTVAVWAIWKACMWIGGAR